MAGEGGCLYKIVCVCVCLCVCCVCVSGLAVTIDGRRKGFECVCVRTSMSV